MIVPGLAVIAAFNLVCTGTLRIDGRSIPETMTFRVDLEARRYCLDDCAETLPIAAVDDGVITFEDSREGAFSLVRTVNRESGRLYDHFWTSLDGREAETTTTGTCTSAPFTGFPSQRF